MAVADEHMLALGGWYGQTSIWAGGWVPLWQVEPLVHLGPKAAGCWQVVAGDGNGFVRQGCHHLFSMGVAADGLLFVSALAQFSQPDKMIN